MILLRVHTVIHSGGGWENGKTKKENKIFYDNVWFWIIIK